MGCRAVISMLSALQADSETSRSWHLFREPLPKAVTTCLDHNPTERERQSRDNTHCMENVKETNTHVNAHKEACSHLKGNLCQ